ncbi:MAG TPA: hypothetical protein VKY42_01345 [Trueperaceae bacterium]|nr:hypothetical protein [Trueperaceae bacterium]
MAKKPLTPAPEPQQRKPRQTVVVERRIEELRTNLRLRLEPLTGERVRIVEYHRKRDGDHRWRRNRDQEGQVYDFAQLGFERSFEDLFPQAELFNAAD